MQAIDLADHLAGLEVDDRNGIGAEFADEQTLAREVDRQVINMRPETIPRGMVRSSVRPGLRTPRQRETTDVAQALGLIMFLLREL